MSPTLRLLDAVAAGCCNLSKAYGLVATGNRTDAAGQVVVLQNRTTAVRFYLDPRDRLLLVQLFRAAPPLYVPVAWGVDERANDPDNGFDLLDLVRLRARAPAASEVPRPIDSEAALRRSVDSYARMLAEYAADVLSGDFASFSELAAARAARRRAAVQDEGGR